ncbi:MAG: YbjQ family protein [Opitutales bacterium]
MELLFTLAIPLAFLGLWALTGSLVAKAHEKRLARRAEQTGPFSLSNGKYFTDVADPAVEPCMVVAEVTIGIDHFRSFLGKLVNLIGGEVRSFTKIADRARREVLQQLKEQAAGKNCDAITNLRIDFANVSGSTADSKKAMMVTILGSGTCYRVKSASTEA